MSTQISDKNKRLDYLDVAKGIGILLVILGHCQLGRIGEMHSLIYSFHMPLFFFVSGVCFSNKYDFTSLAVKRFKQMILPTIYFSVISTLLVEGLDWHVKWWDWSQHFPFALWFLPVLYFAELLAWVICNKISNISCLVLLLFILMLAPHLLEKGSVELPYSIAAIPIATFFYVIGYKLKTYVLKKDKHLWMLTVLLAIFTVIAVRYGHVSIELASGHISPIAVAELTALCGLSSCLCFSKCLTNGGGKQRFIRMLIWFGQNSLCLMLIHQLIKTMLDEYVEVFFHNENIYLFVQWLGTIILSVSLTMLIQEYIPALIGKRKYNASRQ